MHFEKHIKLSFILIKTKIINNSWTRGFHWQFLTVRLVLYLFYYFFPRYGNGIKRELLIFCSRLFTMCDIFLFLWRINDMQKPGKWWLRQTYYVFVFYAKHKRNTMFLRLYFQRNGNLCCRKLHDKLFWLRKFEFVWQFRFNLSSEFLIIFRPADFIVAAIVYFMENMFCLYIFSTGNLIV